MFWRIVDIGLGRAEQLFLACANGLLLVMLAINLVNIVSRLIWDSGIIWVFPWTSVLFVWVIFLAFFVIFRRSQDIVIDVMTRKLPVRLASASAVLVAVLVIALMALVLAQAPTLIPRQVGRIDMVGIQRYWLSAPFWGSCLLIMVQCVLNLRLAVIGVIDGSDPHGPVETHKWVPLKTSSLCWLVGKRLDAPDDEDRCF